MISTALKGVDYLFGPHLTSWASNLHVVVLTLLVIAWVRPLMAFVVGCVKHVPAIEWVMLWRCPTCSTFNRRSFTNCSHCEYRLRTAWWQRWISTRFTEKLKRGRGKMLFVYKLFGWSLFYGITALALFQLRLYSFQQPPLQKLLASVTLAFLLLAFLFFQRAFRPRLKSPLSFLMDVTAGVGVSGFLLFFGFLWAAASFPPYKPLAYVQPLANGQINIHNPSGLKASAVGTWDGKAVQFPVRWAELSWPPLSIRQVFLTHVSGKALMPAWLLSLSDRMAPHLQKDSFFRPRWVNLTQTFHAVPGPSYALYEPFPGRGLALREQTTSPAR